MEFITAHGGQELQTRIDAAEPLVDFVYRSLQESSDITTPGGRAKALEDALTLIYPLRDSYMIDTYFIQIADLLGLDLENVRASSGRVFRDVAKREDAERRREQNYERQRAQAERSGSAGGRSSGSQGTSRGAWASGATPAVAAPVEEGPYDYVPLDAYGATPVEVVDDLPPIDVPDGMGAVPADGPADASAPMVLTDLERKSLAGERELLTMLTSYPDLFRTYADRICSIEWVDPRHESIAWAVLATPPGTDPAACMDAARSVCPEAATLVSAGRISATSKHPTETNIVFMLDTLELYTIKRRMRAAQAKLRRDRSLDDEARRALTVQAAQDSQRQRELQKSIGGVADPFRLIGLEAAGTEQA